MDDLREFDQELAKGLLSTPFDYIPSFELALSEIIMKKDSELSQYCHIGFSGNFGKNSVSPRSLLSDYLGKLVSVEGIVTSSKFLKNKTKASIILPKTVRTVQYNPKKNSWITREIKDMTNSQGNSGFSIQKEDNEGNLLETEYGLCKYKDTQTINIQGKKIKLIKKCQKNRK
jgi:DNA replication licensing factor MCM3